MNITVPTLREHTSPTYHIQYILHISTTVRTWTISKRYSDFVELHKQLGITSLSVGNLPPKNVFKFNNRVIEARRISLEIYLQHILKFNSAAALNLSASWKAFLQIPAQIITWLQQFDTLHDSLTLLRSSIPQVVSLTLKHSLCKQLNGMKDTLSQLQSNVLMEEISNGEKARRVGLVDSDLNLIGDIFNILTPPPVVIKSTVTQFSKSPKSRSARKFGVLESDLTRNVVTADLLQVQQTQMDSQDLILSQLHKVVKRQKDIGELIGHELDGQLEILEIVEEKVMGVELGVKSVNKKIKALM